MAAVSINTPSLENDIGMEFDGEMQGMMRLWPTADLRGRF